MVEIKDNPGGVTFAVRVLPRSSRNEVVGESEGVLRIKLTSPPVDGAANKTLVQFLSDKLDVSKSRITIVTGQTGRSKVIAVSGVSKAEMLEKLG